MYGLFSYVMPKRAKPQPLQRSKKQWGLKDVQRLVVTPKQLGAGGVGTIFVGRIRFADGKWRRVAVKRFESPISTERVQYFQKVITDLSKAGVRLPKMGMVRLPNGEWVQVSQLFSGIRRPGVLNGIRIAGMQNYEVREEMVIELAKIANAGYRPTDDVLEPFQDLSKGAVPIDLDQLVDQLETRVFYPPLRKQKEMVAAQGLFTVIQKIVRLSKLPEREKTVELQRLQKLALQTSKPVIRMLLKRIIQSNQKQA